MHVITTTDQSIKFVARDISSSYSLVLVDEQTKEEVTKTISSSTAGNYQLSDLDFSAKENRYYTIELLVDGDVQYRGKVFCTDQSSLPQYTTLEGEYTEAASSDNEYIIL